ncbi:MAG TPA: 4'-phosphopantetheinyl transferase, partial [Mycobacterium sp.]|nr:4'-phosphopantetheinyl transferase [Mycobacterium sp.]
MTARTLVSSVLPATASEDLAYSELYSDPPGLA